MAFPADPSTAPHSPGDLRQGLHPLVERVLRPNDDDPPYDLSGSSSLGTGVSYPSQAFLNGRFVPALSGKTFPCVSPIHGQTLTQIASCDQEDVDLCVKGARDAFDKGFWSRAHPNERKRTLLRFAQLVEDHAETLAVLESLDVGKPLSNAVQDDLPSSIRCFRWYGEYCDKLYDEMAPSRPSSLSLLCREPLGVVTAVVPWNFPLLMAAWKIAPALATGNSVILKPAEQSPLTALYLGVLAAEAGFPEGVFNVLPGFGETAGQALGRHGDVDAVSFTGSTEIGKRFLQYAGESNMKHVSLECGGKSPNLVFADAYDLDHAAKAQAEGIFYNAGQVCSAASRLLVEESILETFLEHLVFHSRAWQPTHPLLASTKMGAMVDSIQMERVLSDLALGHAQGGLPLLEGGRVYPESGGCYLSPTIFRAPSDSFPLLLREIFGPVLCVLPFKTESQAIALANQSIYGLQASLWTSDLTRAHRVARALKVGTVNINHVDGGDITTPFGGYKQSGLGRDKGHHALEKYTQIKHTYLQL